MYKYEIIYSDGKFRVEFHYKEAEYRVYERIKNKWCLAICCDDEFSCYDYIREMEDRNV